MVSMEWYSIDTPDVERQFYIMGSVETVNDAIMFRKHIFHVMAETRKVMNTLLEDIQYCCFNKYVYEITLFAPSEYNVHDNKQSRILFLNRAIQNQGYRTMKETLFVMYEIYKIMFEKLKKDAEFVDKTFEKIKKIFS